MGGVLLKYLILLLIPFISHAAGKIINADIAPSGTANIAPNKLAASTPNNVCTFDASGYIAGGVAPGASGNVLSSNGTNWVSLANTAALSVGSLDAQAANSNGLALVSNVLSAQSADATHPGMVNNTTQTFSGAKTFSGLVTGQSSFQANVGSTLTPGFYIPTGGGNAGLYFGGSGLTFAYNGGDIASLGASSFRFNTQVNHFFNSTAGTPSIIFQEANSGIYRIAANNLGVSISSTKILDIASTGLSVTGALNVSGTTTLNTGLTGLTRAASGVISAAELSGDVTTSGSNATTIANSAVTNAKMANMANGTTKCRTTSGTGAPEDCTAAQEAAILDGFFVDSVGSYDSVAKSANGATIDSGGAIIFQSAAPGFPGYVSDNAQTFTGAKTFTSAPIVTAGIKVQETTGSGSNKVTITEPEDISADFTFPLPVSDATALDGTMALFRTSTGSQWKVPSGGGSGVGSTTSGGTFTFSSSWGTPASQDIQCYTLGSDKIVCQGLVQAGATTSGTCSFDLPSSGTFNKTINFSKLGNSGRTQQVGNFNSQASGLTPIYGTGGGTGAIFVDGSDTNTLFLGYQINSNAIQKVQCNNMFTNDIWVEIKFEIPVN